jgi:hypothetical protein
MKLKSLLPIPSINEVIGNNEFPDDPIHQFSVPLRNDFHPEYPFMVVVHTKPTPVVVFVQSVEDGRSVINQVNSRDKMNTYNPHIYHVSKEII